MNSTLLDFRGDLDARISAAKASGFWKDATKNEWLNLAGQRVCDFWRWAALELALDTVSRNSKEYYDYPPAPNEFKMNSIYNIIIDGEDYHDDVSGRRRVNWNVYLKAKQQSSDDLIFTNHNGFYFLNPVPEDGKAISIFGLKKWRTLVSDSDESVLPTEFDEAIVRIALAACLRKAKKYGEAKAELLEVLDPNIGILANIKSQQEAEAPQGDAGQAQSSRWN